MRWFCFLAAIAAAVLVTAPTAAALDECIDATCRVSTPTGSVGSGCVFEISQGRVFVLTAGHVIRGSSTATCEFWREGHQSKPLPGKVIFAPQTIDAAVVSVPTEHFGGVLPTAVPFAPHGFELRGGDTITSVGCSQGAWATAWKGHVLRQDARSLVFVPPPAGGRSGSAVFDAEAKQIVALLVARSGDNQEGYAVSLPALYSLSRTEAQGAGDVLYRFYHPDGMPVYESLVEAQYSGDDCPNCPKGPGGGRLKRPEDPRYRISPYRQKEDFEDWKRDHPWPTLPPPSQSEPETPKVAPLPPCPLPPVDPPAQEPDKTVVILCIIAAVIVAAAMYYRREQ